MSTRQRTLTKPEIDYLADSLVRTLGPHIGNPEAVDAALLDWFTKHDVHPLGVVYLAALRRVVADCLQPIPADQLTPDALTFRPDAPATSDRHR